MSCSCNQSPCCCGSSPCQPANVVYQSTCTDPGSNNTGAHLSILDNSFCARRLLNGAGFLENRQTGSGWAQQWTTAPTVPLGTFQAVTNTAFGNFVIIGSDGVWKQLLGPATAGLVLTTNGLGQFLAAVPPAATVPDPLTVNTLNTTTLNVAGVATFNGTEIFNNVPSATITQTIGLNASNQLVIGTAATTGVQTCMFYETPTSPGATSPNEATAPNALLTIGNLLNDSVLPAVPGGALITAINATTLQVVTAGWYNLDACAQINGTSEIAWINLQINGITVNTGNSSSIASQTTTQRIQNWICFASGRFAAGTTITLQLGPTINAKTYAVRLRATRTGP